MTIGGLLAGSLPIEALICVVMALPQIHFDIVPTRLGDDAPLWGAVALAEECLNQP